MTVIPDGHRASLCQVQFPLTVSGQYLVDAGGRPFPILGRSSWGVTTLSFSNYEAFLNDCLARGYTAIEFPAPGTPDGVGNGVGTTVAPADYYGNMPFLKQLDGTTWTAFVESYSSISTQAPDFTTPNPAYWATIDAMLNLAGQKGIAVFWFPAYVGFVSTHQGWMDEMVANGTASMQTYGAWIAARYMYQKNMVWLIGGDRGNETGSGSTYTAPQIAAESAFITGLLSVAQSPLTLVSAEWARNSYGTQEPNWGADLTLMPFYVNATVCVNALAAYDTGIASFMIEEEYDPNDGSIVRLYQWWACLCGIGGWLYGDNNLWPFIDGTWQAALSDPGSLDMQRLNLFWTSLPWWHLVPSGHGSMHTIVTAGGSTSSAADFVSAAAALDGSLCVAYIPPSHSGTITIDMTTMRGSTTSRWFDPTAGTYTADASGLSDTGTHVFTTPGTNVGGQTDWVLRLDA